MAIVGGQFEELRNEFNGRIQRINIDSADYSFGTPLGGWCIRLTNKSGSNQIKGTIVRADTGDDDAFDIAPGDSDEPLGVLAQDIPDNSTGWVIVSGIAEVLLKDSTASTHGNWVGVSDTAGRAYSATEPPAVPAHDREIGHCLSSEGAGTNVLCKVVLHFR